MAVALTVPKVGPTELLDADRHGDTGEHRRSPEWRSIPAQVTGSFANQTVDIKELVLSGPDRESQRRRHARSWRDRRVEAAVTTSP